MIMIDENEYERAKIFFDRGNLVHISKTNGIFLNGKLVEVKPNFVIINDKEIGNQLVFFSELNKELEEYRNNGK